MYNKKFNNYGFKLSFFIIFAILAINIWPSINLVKAESETVIDACGIIDEAGEYILDTDIGEDLEADTACITIAASDVELNGAGFALTLAGDPEAHGISIDGDPEDPYTGIRIENLGFNNFSAGIIISDVSESTIDNVTFATTALGIQAENFSDSTISNSTFTALTDRSVVILDSSDITVTGNTFTDTNLDSVYVNGIDILTITDNDFLRSGEADMEIIEATDVEISGNTSAGSNDCAIAIDIDGLLIDDNVILSTNNDAIRVDSNETSNSDITVSNNEIGGLEDDTIGGDGLEIQDTTTVIVSNNTIYNVDGDDAINFDNSTDITANDNIIGNPENEFDIEDDGFDIRSSSDVTIENNVISNTGEDGVYIASSDQVTVHENTITSPDEDGTDTEDHSTNINITDNTISDTTEHGIEFDGAVTVEVSGNTVSDIALSGIDIDEFSEEATISNNELTDLGARGIEVESTFDVSIEGNTVTNFGLTEEGANYGISVIKSGAFDIDDNEVTADENAIDAHSMFIQQNYLDNDFNYTGANSGDFAWSAQYTANDTVTDLKRALDLTDAEESASFSFFTHYELENCCDSLAFQVQDPETDEWTTLYNTTDEIEAGSTNGEWLEETIDLTAYIGEELQARFRFVTDDTNLEIDGSARLDDFSLVIDEEETFSDDVEDGAEWAVETSGGDPWVREEYAEPENGTNGINGNTVVMADSLEGFALYIDGSDELTILSNIFTADSWIFNNGEDNTFNDDDSGNTYRFADGTPASDEFKIRDNDDNEFADSGDDLPFGEAVLGDVLWDGNGEDEHPRVESEPFKNGGGARITKRSSSNSDTKTASENPTTADDEEDKEKTSSKYNFTDIENHWAKEFILKLAYNCKVEGYRDEKGDLMNIFGPDNSITRAELVKTLIGCETDAVPVATVKPFDDVELKDWYANYIAYAKAEGWISGYSDNTFKPNEIVNRAEATKIILLSQFKESEITGGKMDFSDAEAGQWYEKYIAFAVLKGIMQGYTDESGKPTGEFGVNKPITRGEAAKVVAETKEL